MAIYVLDPHTAELIAAGEVVERPASVVKELVENAIDAGAASLMVEIERGGIAMMRITDDGMGIDAPDIELAFLRHATSKVRTEDDLESIHTLGFRGEALASIASVAKVELLTQSEQDPFASRFEICGGQPGAREEDARPRGTTITVRDLFYNTPARMKFLKKDASEGMYVTETVTRLALSHPEVAFRYVREGKQVFTTPGNGDLLAAAYSVLGPDFARDLVPVGYVDQQYRVLGFVTPPRAGRASRGMQFFFVNGRYVKNRTMMAALEQAYRGTMLHGKYPGGILFLQLPPQLVDVNVHPAKTEIRFASEQDVFGLVYRAVKSALLEGESDHKQLTIKSAAEAPLAEPSPPPAPSAAAFAVRHPDSGSPRQIATYNQMVQDLSEENETLQSVAAAIEYQLSSPFPAETVRIWPQPDIEGPDDEEIPHAAPPAGAVGDQALPVQQALEGQDEEPMQLVGEVFKTYIIAQKGDVMCLIDKHAAHERVLYEEIAANRGAAASQQLLTPVSVALSAAEKAALLSSEDTLWEVGIEVSDFGGNTVLVRGVPSDVDVDDVEGLVVEVARRLSVNAKDGLNEKTEWVMHSIACRAAVKAGDKTQPLEMLALADNIMSGAVPPFCPHGRPVVLEMTRKELEKQFGRLG